VGLRESLVDNAEVVVTVGGAVVAVGMVGWKW
jgi:hypothetical protein